MKSISVLLKENLTSLPYSIGKILAHLPFSKRPGIGAIYAKRKNEIDDISNYSDEQIKLFIFQRMQFIVEYAYENIPFYKNFYDSNVFNPKDLSSFKDLQKIPIINKAILQNIPLEERSAKIDGRYIVNTGGSSGKPLSLYVTPDSMGHEWAHMHTIWETIGYKIQDLKISFGGRSSGKEILEYDSVRHSYNFNIYFNLEEHKDFLLRFFRDKNVKYLHGYPSAIYEFSLYCSKDGNRDLKELVKSKIKGVFFGSEFPIESWRNHIEKTFDAKSISWYGHTERAILAYERSNKYEFEPFHSYGFAESILIDNKEQLVSTAYYNLATPLIRYNTEDVIAPKFRNNILHSFSISEGRIGEYVVDKDGVNIPLTGLIFGRHHKLFDVCSHLQVSQENVGLMTVLYTPIDKKEILNPNDLFDAGEVNIDISFRKIDAPIKTKSGKVKLLVKI